jgi:hypothetical protein
MSADWSAQYWAEKSRANRLASTVDEWVAYARRLESEIAKKDKVIASYKAALATRDAELAQRYSQISELVAQLMTERADRPLAAPSSERSRNK